MVNAYLGEPAEAVCVFVFNGLLFKGAVKGGIVEPRGKQGFGWDCVFLPDGHKKTFAEMTVEEKNAVSPRRLALEELRKIIYGGK